MRLTVPFRAALACTASILAATTALGTGGTATAAAPLAQANVSDFLGGQLSSLTGRTTVLVHGTSITAARQAVAATGLA